MIIIQDNVSSTPTITVFDSFNIVNKGNRPQDYAFAANVAKFLDRKKVNKEVVNKGHITETFYHF